jgi:hypothetical protein
MIQTVESLEVEKFQDYELRILIHLGKIFEQSFLTREIKSQSQEVELEAWM